CRPRRQVSFGRQFTIPAKLLELGPLLDKQTERQVTPLARERGATAVVERPKQIEDLGVVVLLAEILHERAVTRPSNVRLARRRPIHGTARPERVRVETLILREDQGMG